MSTIIDTEYVSFATKKHSGDWVATPLWCAPADGRYFIFSAADAGKVKRLRNYSEIRAAACTFNGRVTSDWLDGHGELINSDEDVTTAYAALNKKYGFKMKATDFFSKLAGKYTQRQLIAFTLNES
mgnify:CR=1 FL=1